MLSTTQLNTITLGNRMVQALSREYPLGQVSHALNLYLYSLSGFLPILCAF